MIKFTKMEGIGNDYIYVETITQKIENVSLIAQKISDRHFGVGSDGLILIGKSMLADFKMNIYNIDGSEAEMCGNGIRCLGKFVYDKGLTDKTCFTVETLAGIKVLNLILEDGKVKLVKVDMGEPILDASKVPVIDSENRVFNKKIEYPVVSFRDLFNDKVEFTCVSMGNPHAICFISDIYNFDIEKYGPLVENSVYFPNRANITFAQVINRNEVKMCVWERGVGETLACGTGACACAVASILNGYTDGKVEVSLLGGKLWIEWTNDNHIYLTGPAQTVFEGEIDLNNL